MHSAHSNRVFLTSKYLRGIPRNSRVAKDGRYLKKEDITEEVRAKIIALNEIAKEREQFFGPNGHSMAVKG